KRERQYERPSPNSSTADISEACNGYADSSATRTITISQGSENSGESGNRDCRPHSSGTQEATTRLNSSMHDGGSPLHVVPGNKEDEWRTPRHILEAVENALGRIDLDPAADTGKLIPALGHYTLLEDGLNW